MCATGGAFRCEHLPAESNTIADSLSCLSEVPAKPFQSCFVHVPCCHKISACLKTVRNTCRTFRATWSIGVCSHPSRIAFSVRCLSSLLQFGVSLRSVFLRLWVCSHPRPFAFSQQILSGFVLTWCFRALQCNTTLGFVPTCVCWHFLGTFCRVCSHPRFRALQCKATLGLVPPVSLCVVRPRLELGLFPPVYLGVSRTRFAMGLLSPLSLSQRPPDRL